MNAGKIPTTSLREESQSEATSSLHWNESADSITDKASSRIGYNRRTIPPSHPYVREKQDTQVASPILDNQVLFGMERYQRLNQIRLKQYNIHQTGRRNTFGRTDCITSSLNQLSVMNCIAKYTQF